MKRTLLLGGTAEALGLAHKLPANAIYSLAGLGEIPNQLPCACRVGGFGGAEGLAAFIREENIELLVDATHPYAQRISQNAVSAAVQTGIPCWALRRAAWQAQANDDWREWASWDELCTLLAPFRRPLFTLGREPLSHIDSIPTHQHWLIRCLGAELMEGVRARVLAARGPFNLADELRLLEDAGVDVIVSKNGGSVATEAKVQAARELGLPILLRRRPPLPPVDREFFDSQSLWLALDQGE